jgi:hypothetical protein
MPDSASKLREISWTELFPWLMLARSVRIALLARVLVLGAIGLIATTIGWKLLGRMYSRSEDPTIELWRNEATQWVWERNSREFTQVMSSRSADEIFFTAWEGLPEAPVTIWLYLTRPFRDMFSDVSAQAFFFLLLCAVWELAVWGLIGGAITRIAALKFTRDETPGFLAALQHAAKKWPSYSLPAAVALAGAAVFAIQLVVVGAIMNLGLLAFLAALVWPFVLMLGLLMAILLLGALIGWPLMWATVSVEGTDAFDAISRSYAYTYQRPWRLLWYVLFVGILAVVSMFVVKVFAATAIALGDWSIDWGLNDATMESVVRHDVTPPATPVLPPPLADTVAPNPGAPVVAQPTAGEPAAPRELSLLFDWARAVIYFWKSLMGALTAGYQAGFLWASAVGVYLLLRQDIDGVQTGDVYVDQDDEYGLPPLEADPATGVPEISPTGPAQTADIANPNDLPRSD